MAVRRSDKYSVVFAISLLTLAGCSDSETVVSSTVSEDEVASYHPFASDVVTAINIGGRQYTATDGITYRADELNVKGKTGKSELVKGSQDPELYKTYIEGPLSLALPMQNGAYAVTFKFAEPLDIPVGERVFDVFAEDQRVIDKMDVRLARDNQPYSALERTVNGIEVHDGMLNLDLRAVKGEPLLHALIVRKANQDPRKWEIVWRDEFDTDGAPNPAKWRHDIWPARKVNDEDQAYTADRKNSRVEDGMLIIEAHKEEAGDAEYSSARLHNRGFGDLHYGRIDVRARLPAGRGTWSAIWMLPSDAFNYASTCEAGEDWQGSSTCDAWPNSGEIDIMEHVGYDMHRVHGTVHNKAYYWINWEQRKASIEGVDVDKAFHTYSLEWSPESIIVYFDNVPYFHYLNQGEGWMAWPYDHPYHLILNLAIGGVWGRAGGPIDDSIFPVSMEIDYVRISKLTEDAG